MAQADEQIAIRTALAAMTTGQPPAPPGRYSAVRRRVVTNRRRRLASVALAVAVLVAAAIAVPLGWLRAGTHAPEAPRYHVNVLPRPPGSPPGLVATGRIDGTVWRAEVTMQSNGDVCENGVFPRETVGGCASGPPASMTPTGYPVGNLAGTWPGMQVDFATVRADVTSVQIGYGNGQVVTVTPHRVFAGPVARYIAFAAPYSAAVTRITAFAKDGPIGYAVPFTAGPYGAMMLVRWLRPGQPALPAPARYLAGTGVLDGRRWRDDVYIGPWGTCFVHPTTALDCFPGVGWLSRHPSAASVLGFVNESQIHVGYAFGQAEPAVRYLIMTTARGRAIRVPALSAGSRRFFVFGWKGDSNDAVRWAAYDAAGNELGSGPMPLAG